jgi:hypothetical protein
VFVYDPPVNRRGFGTACLKYPITWFCVNTEGKITKLELLNKSSASAVKNTAYVIEAHESLYNKIKGIYTIASIQDDKVVLS